jgi:hypothetical protein
MGEAPDVIDLCDHRPREEVLDPLVAGQCPHRVTVSVTLCEFLDGPTVLSGGVIDRRVEHPAIQAMTMPSAPTE